MSDYNRLKQNITILNMHNHSFRSVKQLTDGRKTENQVIDEIVHDIVEILDKIEQGTLIELLCKVGDTVCKYYKVENGMKIYSGTVIKIEMRKNGIMIYITSLPNFYYDKDLIGDLTKGYIDTTCYYFCPVEEAEKRLLELQGETKL